MLRVEDLAAGYGSKRVVRGLSLEVQAGACVGIVGPNGAGKSTALMAVFGVLRPMAGRVHWGGHDLTHTPPAHHVAQGLALVPQGGRVFASLSVEENLGIGGYTVSDRQLVDERMREVCGLFPVLGERRRQRAGSLSGGERQMLALGMALMIRPRLLLLDEPSIGLAPIVVTSVMQTIQRVNREMGVSVLIVEQNARALLPVVSCVHVMQGGRIRRTLDPAQLQNEDALRQALLA